MHSTTSRNRNQTSDTYNRRAENLSEEDQAIMNVANELHMRMLTLEDENSNRLEVAQREREREAMEE